MIDANEKELMRRTFKTYDPAYHSAFTTAYTRWAEGHGLWAWNKDRNPLHPGLEPKVEDYDPSINFV